MELDELKSVWAQYDKKLSENLKFNEALLKIITKNSSKRELQKPLNFEILNIIAVFLGGVYIISMSVKHIEEFRFCIPGFFSIMIGLVYFVFSIIKVNRFISIDYIGSPIVKLRKDIAKLNKLFLETRKYELILMPFIPISILPLLYKSIANIDIYNDLKKYTFGVLIVLIISIPTAIWINKNFTDKKMNNANRILEDLEKYEKEE
jgi:hypothetical protein